MLEKVYRDLGCSVHRIIPYQCREMRDKYNILLAS